MQTVDPSYLMNQVADLSFADKGISSAKVILTGFVVVFSMLILLIIVIKIYGMIVGKAQGTGLKKRKVRVKSPEKPAAEVKPSAEVKPAVNDDGGVPEEIVAVIAAAVESMYGGKEKVRIRKIKKSRSERSAWAKAGVIDNTRPF